MLISFLVGKNGNAQKPLRPIIQKYNVQLGDLDQHYRLCGNGQPLLLIHGLTLTWRIWHPYIDFLATKHKLIIPDIRGHGDTPNPSDSLTQWQVARDMLALLDTLGIEQVQIIGYSFGGHIALRMAALKPRRVEAMIIVAGAHRLIGYSRKVHEEEVQLPIPSDWWLDEVSKWHPGGEEQVRCLYRQGTAAALSDGFAISDSSLKNISARTLIIQGDRDYYFPIEVAVDLYHKLPTAQLWVIPNAGHAAIFVLPGIAPMDVDFGGSMLASRIFPEIVESFLTRNVP